MLNNNQIWEKIMIIKTVKYSIAQLTKNCGFKSFSLISNKINYGKSLCKNTNIVIGGYIA